MFSTGGYIAVPVCLAAGLKGIPYVLMNSDADPLLSIKMVQGNAAGVMCGFDGKAAKLAGDKGVVTGNPVRQRNPGDSCARRALSGQRRPIKTADLRRLFRRPSV